jgi:hypothetical protein
MELSGLMNDWLVQTVPALTDWWTWLVWMGMIHVGVIYMVELKWNWKNESVQCTDEQDESMRIAIKWYSWSLVTIVPHLQCRYKQIAHR